MDKNNSFLCLVPYEGRLCLLQERPFATSPLMRADIVQ